MSLEKQNGVLSRKLDALSAKLADFEQKQAPARPTAHDCDVEHVVPRMPRVLLCSVCAAQHVMLRGRRCLNGAIGPSAGAVQNRVGTSRNVCWRAGGAGKVGGGVLVGLCVHA